MALAPGVRLGPYEIQSALGAGGMGEVYRAIDTNLGRQVAIKVLPEAFAGDADRLARFEREAKALAALNHPNIAQVYGLERAAQTSAIVMELVEGPTLADILAGRSEDRPLHSDDRRGRPSGRPFPLDDALPIARQIADALEAAHEQGIIHRDLKPANIKVRDDGVVKVLDFGLAKLTGPAEAGHHVHPDLSASPTITSPAMMTGAGVILGTAGYMAPEQAKGRPADRRADIWAFGCVLYEMLTGKRAFAADDVTETLARILLKEPEWEALPRSTPPALVRLLRRCLEKDPRQRLPHIAIARYEIQESRVAVAPVAALGPSGRRPWLAWAAGFGIIAAAAIGFTAAFVPDGPASSPVTRFTVGPPADSALRRGVGAGYNLALSPDGRRLVFVVSSQSQPMLALRTLDTLESRLLAGTEGTNNVPFWSPDGRYVAFFADGKLKRIDLDGGPSQVLADAPGGLSGAWSPSGVIVFSTGLGALRQVAAAGGMPADLTALDTARGETSHRYPRFLPDGNRFLYIAQPGRTVFLAGLDGRAPRVVLSGVSAPFYLDPGFLVYTRAGTLSAQRFDLDAERLSDEVVSLVERIWQSTAEDSASLSVSNTGALAYATLEDALELISVDRASGRERMVGGIRGQNMALAPSGLQLAFTGLGAGQAGIWIFDLERQITSPLALSTSTEQFTEPSWSPDGRKVAFRATRPSGVAIVAKPANGGSEETLYDGPGRLEDWSPDGQHLILQPGRQSLVVPLAGGGNPVVFSTEDIDEPHFSPDGRWIAYNTSSGAVPEVYVTRFPPTGERWRISLNGGAQARWRGDGRELYFIAPDGRMMAAAIQMQPDLKPGIPQALFDTRLSFVSTGIDQYGVTADGQRFFIARPPASSTESLVVVLNWVEELKRLLPAN